MFMAVFLEKFDCREIISHFIQEIKIRHVFTYSSGVYEMYQPGHFIL